MSWSQLGTESLQELSPCTSEPAAPVLVSPVCSAIASEGGQGSMAGNGGRWVRNKAHGFTDGLACPLLPRRTLASSAPCPEKHRTQTLHKDAFTFKVFIFQFVYFYPPPFYVAFFKGR